MLLSVCVIQITLNLFITTNDISLIFLLFFLRNCLTFHLLLNTAEGPTPEVIVTKPSPEQTIISLGLRPDNSTLVHVLVHRESEEYKEEDEDNERDIASPASNGMGMLRVVG